MSRYDSWKLDTPPRFEDSDMTEHCPRCGHNTYWHRNGEATCARCDHVWLLPDCREDDADEPTELDATPLVTDDDPDNYISDDPRCYREFGGEG